MTSKTILCIDAGASSSKWTMRVGAGHFLSGMADPITGHIFSEADWEKTKLTLQKIASESEKKVNEVILGVTGLDNHTEVSNRLTPLVSDLFPVAKVTLMNDMELAYSAFLSPGEGIYIYAGTGAMAANIDANNIFHRAGGWGFMIADEGGGFWLGREGLRHVTQLWDIGKDPMEDGLARAVLIKANAADWNELRTYVYSNGRRAVAALAPAVGEAANAGSSRALEMIQEAGIALADLTKKLDSRMESQHLIAMGGVLKIHPAILQSLQKNVSKHVQYKTDEISRAWLERNR
jgi:glucosamine kinase